MVYHQPAIAIPVNQVRATTRVIASPLAPRGSVRIVAPQIGIDSDLAELPENHPLRRSLKIIQNHFGIDHIPACEIRISSTIPVGSGLGSSASSSVSLIRAVSEFLGHPLDDEETSPLAFEMERLHHGNPSGIDNTVITFARPVFFKRGSPIEFIDAGKPLEFLIADTGIRASTSEAVERVREKYQSNPQQFDAIFSEMGALTHQVRACLVKGKETEFGPLLTQNHGLLKTFGVSCLQLDRLVEAALDAGAYGAKLSGGGLGGNMLALIDQDIAEGVERSLIKAGAVSVIRTSLLPPSENRT